MKKKPARPSKFYSSGSSTKLASFSVMWSVLTQCENWFLFGVKEKKSFSKYTKQIFDLIRYCCYMLLTILFLNSDKPRHLVSYNK